MAKKRKVINKNLIGMLTVAGMILSVAIVWILVNVIANKDPEIWASKGREYMEQGKYEDAQRMFYQAHEFSKDDRGRKDVQYLLAFADAQYLNGDVGNSFGSLVSAHAISPDDTDILNKIIERLWQFRWYFGDRSARDELQYTEKLLALEPDNADALAMRIIALTARGNRDDDNEAEADRLLEQARERFPKNSRVAIAELITRDRQLRSQLVGITDQQELKRLTDEFREFIIATAKPAAEAHPEDMFLTRVVVTELATRGDEELAIELMNRAVAARPDDPNVLREVARLYLSLAQSRVSDGKLAEGQAFAEKAIEAANAGREIAPGILELVTFLGSAQVVKSGGFSNAADEDFEKALTLYDTEFKEWLNLKNKDAWFSRRANEHVSLILNAFRTASFYASDFNDKERLARGREWMKKFVEQGNLRFADSPVANFMQGSYYIAAGERARATTEFEKAARSPAEMRIMFLRNFGVIPAQNLALLYRDLRQPGEALKWTDTAIEQYEELNIPPSIETQLNRAELLNELGREQESFDFLNSVRSAYDFDPRIDQVRARSLQKLGRANEAAKILAALGSDNDSIRFSKAEALYANEQYDAAAAELKEILKDSPANIPAARMLLDIYTKTERKAEAIPVLDDLLARVEDDNARRQMEAWRVVLTVENPEDRRQQLKQLITSESDPFKRAIYRYQLEYIQKNYEQAQVHLDEAEKIKPDDIQVLEFQIGLAAQSKDWPRAEKYVVRLSELNGDNADGATYRGSLALARGDCAEALKYFFDAQSKLPTLSSLKFKIAQAHVCLGQKELALEVLNQAVKSNPRDTQVRLMLYELLREQGRNEEAAEHLRVAVAVDPNNTRLKEAQEFLEEEEKPWEGVNRRLARLKDNPDDIQNIKRIAELLIKSRDIAIQAGDAKMRDESTRRAEEMITRGLETDPHSAVMVNFAKKYYLETGQVEKAEAAIDGFADGNPNPRAELGRNLMLAELYEQLNKFDDVDSAFDRARKWVETSDLDEKQRRMTLLQLSFQELAFNARIGRESRSYDIAQSIKANVNREDPDEESFYRLSQIQLARSLLAQRKAVDAEPILRDYLEIYPTDTDGVMLRAEMWLQRGFVEKAIDDLTKVLTDQPDNLLVRYTRADLLMRTRQYSTARDDLRKVKAQVKASDDEEVKESYLLATIAKLATLFEITEQYPQAEAELREMIEVLGRNLDKQAAQQLAADRLLRLFKRTDRLDRAETVCAEFMAKYPSAPYWPFQLGLLLNEREKYSAAADRFQQAMTIAMDRNVGLFSVCFSERLKSLMLANRAADAVAVFERREVADVAPVVTFTASRAFRKTDQERQADELELEAVRDGLRRTGGDLQRLVIEMAEQYDSTQFQNAWDRLAESVSDRTELARIRNIQAQDHIANKELEKALTRLDAGLAIDDKNAPEHVAALVMQAQSMDQLGRFEEAKRAYEAILVQRPEEVSTLNNIAYLLATKLDQPQAALKYSQQAINIKKDTAPLALIDTHAWILHLNGRDDEAEGRMREGLSQDPYYLPLVQHLAMLLEEKGNTGQATKLYLLMQDIANRDIDSEYQKKAKDALQRLQ